MISGTWRTTLSASGVKVKLPIPAAFASSCGRLGVTLPKPGTKSSGSSFPAVANPAFTVGGRPPSSSVNGTPSTTFVCAITSANSSS